MSINKTLLQYKEALKVLKEKGSYAEAAKALGLSRQAMRSRVRRAKKHLHKSATAQPTLTVKPCDSDQNLELDANGQGGQIKSLEELLAEAKISSKEWEVTKWECNKWDAMGKEGSITPMWQVKAWLSHRPDWSLQPVTPVKHIKRQAFSPSNKTLSRALIIPDSQNGYHVNRRTGYHDPLHDRKAWDLSVQMATQLQPDYIVLLGDMLDLASWSMKYQANPTLKYTTQPTLLELHWWIGQLRLAAPQAKILYMEGNHESRMSRVLGASANTDETLDLCPVNDLEGHSVMSVPRLLALDSLDVEYSGPYGTEYWLWDTVRIHHGQKVRSGGGKTSSAVVRDATFSEVFGHVHRLEYACKTVHGPTGERLVFAMSPGTICRLDGVVPANGPRQDWQQGLAVLSHNKVSNTVTASVVPIQKGQLIWDGRVFSGEERIDEIQTATGWNYKGSVKAK